MGLYVCYWANTDKRSILAWHDLSIFDPIRTRLGDRSSPSKGDVRPPAQTRNVGQRKQNRILQFARVELIWNSCFWQVLHPSHCYFWGKS